ncbi:MAG: hypothetical protein A2Y17_08220 [Clostridiales bacterium GWF2_38_85]|nr:MAG: hypothetical protein A2Y17_08220 [Clostridiales bacterium GWF2_38_85]
MRRRQKKFMLMVIGTVLSAVLTVFLTSAVVDRFLIVPAEATVSEALHESESTSRIELLSDDTIASLLGYNYGYAGNSSVLFVKAVNLSMCTEFDEPTVYLFNSTDYNVNVDEFTDVAYPVSSVNTEEPTVLIVHTHGTEAYVDGDREYYSADDTFRSQDIEKNVVAVGKVMADRLNELGIVTIHDTRMHDKDSYSDSYTNSYNAVAEYIKEYPTIKYVIDLHRDSIFSSSNENQKPVTTINGEKVAQIMIVVGSNQKGGHPNWKQNLTVAVVLQEKFNNYPTFGRPIYLRTANFNQQLLPGMLLLEVGSCGNTLDEAKHAAYLAADCMAEMIGENSPVSKTKSSMSSMTIQNIE